MSTRWTLSVTLILLLVASTAFAVESDIQVASIDQDGETQVSRDDSDDEIVIQFGDPDDLITGNRGVGVAGSIMGLSTSAALSPDYDGSYFFLTLSQVLFLVR